MQDAETKDDDIEEHIELFVPITRTTTFMHTNAVHPEIEYPEDYGSDVMTFIIRAIIFGIIGFVMYIIYVKYYRGG